MLNFIDYIKKTILGFSRTTKKIIFLVVDTILFLLSLSIAYYLRIDQFIFFQENYAIAAIIGILIFVTVFWFFGFYNNMLRFPSKNEIVHIFNSVILYGLTFFFIVSVYTLKGVPRSIGILQPLIFLFLIYSSRILIRHFLFRFTFKKYKKESSNVLIYGAGRAGRQLLNSLENEKIYNVAAFIDDDSRLHGEVLHGKKIHSSKNLEDLIKSENIKYILLAMPSIKRNRRHEIIDKISNFKVILRSLPNIEKLVDGSVMTSEIRDLDINDLLTRQIILPKEKLLINSTKSKVILVTGAGGSIGSELSRQIIKLNPKSLILVEMNEYALYKIFEELIEIKKKNNLIKIPPIYPLLTSTQDKDKMKKIIKTYEVDIIYHSAAYKHVPLVEENICEGIKNNVFGTLSVVEAALEENISNFVLISSDKAVRPTNVMGASKRIAELCLQSIKEKYIDKKTKLSMVRFGNVLGSSGSVIPKFKKQIKYGGPITLTHPDVTRYFMTIPEAAQLVLQSSFLAKGSDVFALDMGEPIKIIDLITKIVSLSGLSIRDDKNINGDIEIKLVGLRPGEKLYEEIFLGDDLKNTEHEKIYRAQDPSIPWIDLEIELQNLKDALEEENIYQILSILEKLVKNYKKNQTIVDHLFIKRKKN